MDEKPMTASEIILQTSPIKDEELVEGAIFYTTRYQDDNGNEMYLAYRDMLARSPGMALHQAMDYLIHTVVVGLRRMRTDPIVCKMTQITLAAEAWAGPMKLNITLLAGPIYEEGKAAEMEKVADSWRERQAQNRLTHKNIELIGEGELAFCRDCNGGEQDLWDQSCIVRQSMNKVGLS